MLGAVLTFSSAIIHFNQLACSGFSMYLFFKVREQLHTRAIFSVAANWGQRI